MKKIRNAIVVLSIGCIFIINMTVLFEKGQGVDFSLSQLLNFNSAQASEGVIDPNTHSGFISDTVNKCCKRRYHDDECTGTLC